ncbi:ClpP class serine protease [Deinobacterium chartae]|uniref:ClpP class serine protease n=1 Tax=Deinobacterium chartae TaxID=521158 RepID=A0A841I375_9DEIO|nr:ATP-dependent Clp protease proteolytic subunit [Deinobacterium chartae]MBB6098809.1 ClpP class serine protease [Deinobacterium chartae]
MDVFGLLLWVFVILSVLSPALQRRVVAARRAQALLALERRRGSRVITLIHRQEAISLLGVPVSRYIDVDDSEQLLRAVRLTDDHVPIDLVLHTPGGVALAAEQIAEALQRHPAKVTVFVPHYAMSGGTLIALGADEIVMDANAVLGPVDPQINTAHGPLPAASVLRVLEQKPLEKISDETLILADVAQKALAQMQRSTLTLLLGHMPAEKAAHAAQQLSQGRFTHDYAISVTEARDLGLAVSTEMPLEVYALMELYPQPRGTRSVSYVPTPYSRPGGSEHAR